MENKRAEECSLNNKQEFKLIDEYVSNFFIWFHKLIYCSVTSAFIQAENSLAEATAGNSHSFDKSAKPENPLTTEERDQVSTQISTLFIIKYILQ